MEPPAKVVETPTPTPADAPRPWDGFLVGPENALAHAAVLALARGEAGLSPLVLHGPPGSGKTRLLAGLVAERLARRPGGAVAHLSAEGFAALCAGASGEPGGWCALRDRFRKLDLLVVEDLHALERAPLALEELAHTLDALDEAGALVSCSAREAPARWSGWPLRLISRLTAGLAVRVDPPGLESRRRFVLERARGLGLTVAAEGVEALAGSADGYRPLDGLLARLALAARVGRRPIDAPLVAEALADGNPGPGRDSSAVIEPIAREVASRFGLRLRELRSASRRRALVEPRHLAMFLARSRTGRSFAAIGAYFGGRDAATVRHACRMAESRLAADPALAAVAAAMGLAGGVDGPGDEPPSRPEQGRSIAGSA